MENALPIPEGELLLLNLFLIIVITIVVYSTILLLNKIRFRLAIRKIRKISEKKSLKGFILKTNAKGFPLYLVSRDDASEIVVL